MNINSKYQLKLKPERKMDKSVILNFLKNRIQNFTSSHTSERLKHSKSIKSLSREIQ
jgi:hypothetical protein